MCISDGVFGSTLKMLKPAGSDTVETAGRGGSSRSRFRLRLPPRPGAPASTLCWRRMCLARASERVKDLSHSVWGQGSHGRDGSTEWIEDVRTGELAGEGFLA